MANEKGLRAAIREKKRLLVAFSGGLDSSVLAKIAAEELGDNVIAVTVNSETFPKAELHACKSIVSEIGIKHIIFQRSDLKDEKFAKNPINRCYFCRFGIARVLRNTADENNIQVIADGANSDDLNDYRPGLKAFNEAEIWHPFIEFGFSKKDIRELADSLSLSVKDKPSLACLASRIPYNEEITEDKLRRIESAEEFLRALGFRQVRVRYLKNDVAKIEVMSEKLPHLLDPKLRQQVIEKLKDIGFKHVTIDLEGYRTGSMNIGIAGK